MPRCAGRGYAGRAWPPRQARSGSPGSDGGTAASTNGTGILGHAEARQGLTFGVQGISDSAKGTGVLAQNTRATGTALKVIGKARFQGDVLLSAGGKLGFYGAAGAAKPTVSGSTGGNEALASLIDALELLGLITDATT